MRPVNRPIVPRLPAKAFKTYIVLSPHDTAIRAVCEQVGCRRWHRGWKSIFDESTPRGRDQAAYVRCESGRTFREQRTGEGLTVFLFEPYQRCFEDHQTWPEVYFVRGGDWRGNPTGQRRVHTRAADWVEDFALHQQRLADQGGQ